MLPSPLAKFGLFHDQHPAHRIIRRPVLAALLPEDLASLQERLGHYRDLTLGALLAVVPESEPQGYLYQPLKQHLAHMGKGLRPALCLATCQAFGGTEDQALKSAVALEMIHNAFLVHDDVEDIATAR